MTTQTRAPISPASVEDEIAALGPWFHNLHLPDGRQTCPDHWAGDFPAFKWNDLAPHVPQDLSGWSCLDIGCNAGFYSFELARRGGRVRFERMQVYDLARLDERFDLVLFMGVLYHLRYPMLGLDTVAQKVNRLMVFQTMTMPGEEVFAETDGRGFTDRDLMLKPGWPKMAFIEHHFASDPTNWWAPNHAGVEAMLRSAGMRVVGRPGHEIYLCEPDPERPSCVTTWNAAEYLSATGRPWRS